MHGAQTFRKRASHRALAQDMTGPIVSGAPGCKAVPSFHRHSEALIRPGSRWNAKTHGALIRVAPKSRSRTPEKSGGFIKTECP